MAGVDTTRRAGTVRDELLHFGGGCGMAVDDVGLRERRRAEEAQGHCDGGGDQGLRHGWLRSLQRVADTTENADQAGGTR
jgi:hypothetical protein